MNVPAELLYSKDHEWILMEGDVATIGITDFAQDQLGDIVFVDIVSNTQLAAGDVFGTIEAVKTVSDLFAPLIGSVIAVNPALVSEPELVNKDPYVKGWMIKMKILDQVNIAALLDADAYTKMIS